MKEVLEMRPMNMRALGVPGALISTTIMAAAPSVASSDTATTTTAATTATAKRSTTLSVGHVRRDVLAGGNVVVRGTLRPAAAGRVVSLQVSGGHHRWTTVDHDS